MADRGNRRMGHRRPLFDRGDRQWGFRDQDGAARSLLVALGVRLRASNRERLFAPQPQLSGPELARFKAQLMRPGNARSTPTWLVFDDEALNLLGRYYAPSN